MPSSPQCYFPYSQKYLFHSFQIPITVQVVRQQITGFRPFVPTVYRNKRRLIRVSIYVFLSFLKGCLHLLRRVILYNPGSKFLKSRIIVPAYRNVRKVGDGLFKEPGGGHTPWHQDQIWPVDTEITITLWMPLVDIPQEVGSMQFASGSHKRGYISKLVISDESPKRSPSISKRANFPLVSHGAMAAGDATFHAGWTLHSAPGNPTPNTREVMTVIYVADQTTVLKPDTNARKNDLARWMPGLNPGDLIDSPLNPLMYQEGK